MKRLSAFIYYVVLVAVPVFMFLTLMGAKTEQVLGGEEQENWRTICHVTGHDLLPIFDRNVDINDTGGLGWFNYHFGDTNHPSEGQSGTHDGHIGDVWFAGKNQHCPGDGEPSLTPTQTPPTPTPSVSMTPIPTQTPQPTGQPTLTPVPTQPPAVTATPKPEENNKSMNLSKSGPNCEERTFSVSVQLKDDGKEAKNVGVSFTYLNQTKSMTTNNQGRGGVDLDYAGKGEVRAEAEGWPTARVTVDELTCDEAVGGKADGGDQGGVSGQSQEEDGKILGYANTGVNTEAMILLIQSVGLLMIVGGSVVVVKA